VTPKTTPKIRKGIQRIQQNRERPTVRRMVKTGSLIKTRLLSRKSNKMFATKRETPKKRLRISQSKDRKSENIDSPTTTTQRTASQPSVFLKGGRKKRDE